MNKKNVLIILLSIILAISICLSSAENIVFNEKFHQKEFLKNNVYENVKNADEINKKLIGFFKDSEEIPENFTEKEKMHLNDVKNLISNGKNFSVFLNLMCIALFSLILFFYKENTKEIYKILILSGIIGIIIPLLFVPFAFSKIFTLFHVLFFTGNWIFSNNSLLIMMYSETFFFNAFASIITKALIIFSVFIFLGFLIKHLVNKK